MKKKIGKRIQIIRLQNNVTQEQMADALCISTSAYCKLEYGETDLTLTRVKKLAEIFNMPMLEFINRLLDGIETGASENECSNAEFSRSSVDKILLDFVGQSKDVVDKMVKDMSRFEQKLDKMELRINNLENFHMK